MNITEVVIRKIYHYSTLKALISVTIHEEFVIHDIKVIEGGMGRLFVALPSRKEKSGKYRDVAHPKTSKARKSFEAQILSAYHEHLEKAYLPETGVINA